jgi:hypothetical protein
VGNFEQKPAKIAKRMTSPLIKEMKEIQIMFGDFMSGGYPSHKIAKRFSLIELDFLHFLNEW